MINHTRTLLLNAGPGPADVPWEEYVPDVKAVPLPPALRAVHQLLFGTSPDRSMMNYRLRQYLTALEGTELQSVVTSPDNRLTYQRDPEEDTLDESFLPSVEQLDGVPAQLHVYFENRPPDVSGRMSYGFDVHTISTVDVEVSDLKTGTTQLRDYALTNGLSQPVPTPNPGITVGLTSDAVGSSWRVEGLLRPVWSFGQIVALSRQIGEPTLLELFGAAREGIDETLYNCWADHPDTVYQLGGLVLALSRRIDEVRRGQS